MAWAGVEGRRLNNIPIYIQQDATLHSLFYLGTALHISGGTSTHHQKGKQLYLQHVVFVTPLLLPAAIVEMLELQLDIQHFHDSGSYTVYVIWELLYMFHVVPPPIIRSANNCIYSIWYSSHRYCYLLL